MIKINSCAPDIIRYRTKAKDLELLEQYLADEALSANKVLGKDCGLVVNNPIFDEYDSFLKTPETHCDWARANLIRNGYKISEVNDKDLDVYLINSPEASKKYIKTFISGIKSCLYSQIDLNSAHKKARRMTKDYISKYQKSSFDYYDMNRELYYSMNKMYENVGSRFEKYLKKFKIENVKVEVND